MRKWVIGIGVTLVAGALGVGAAYGGSQLLKTYAPQNQQAAVQPGGEAARGAAPLQERRGFGGMPGQRMRDTVGEQRGIPNIIRNGNRGENTAGPAITLTEAISKAEAYASAKWPDLQLAKAVQFQDGFDLIFTEKTTGRGAVEVVVSPSGDAVGILMGPATVWNLKYGLDIPRQQSSGATDNTLAEDAARQAAQQALDGVQPGATLNTGGYSFYGYYVFEYSINGQTAGMLGVNGLTGQVWSYDRWFGSFLSEKEV